jgi:ribosome maturation factor RimP
MERISLTEDPTLQAVFGLAENAFARLPYEPLYLEWGSESGQRVLRVYIDRRDGGKVDVGDCAEASRILDQQLEAADPVPFAYTLEVSSPGVNRPLVKREDFSKNVGKVIRLEAKEPIDGRKRFHGRLESIEDEFVQLSIDRKAFRIPFAAIRKATLDYFADQKG